ncbi:hypothetical protein R0381_002809 [Jeongeupia wiesaeckerbachi]|uniref:hypothetical protein n=1 Tax=Jeongeupia wiesaeckerbachi TaxID=3051218 RepID=UPI003D805C3F
MIPAKPIWALLLAAVLWQAPQAIARTNIDIYVGISPPVRIEQAPPVRPGYAWRPGSWVAVEPRSRYRWRRGYWARDPHYRSYGDHRGHRYRHHGHHHDHRHDHHHGHHRH